MDELKHKLKARVFVNANGLKAIRIPDLLMAVCSNPSCRGHCFVESAANATYCTECGHQRLRVSADWVQPEPFLVQEPRGPLQLQSLAILKGDNDDTET